MKAKLLTLLPGMRWIPHDIPSQDSAKPKHKSKSRNPFSSKHAAAPHGALRARKSNISLTSEPDAELDARTHAQGQSMFFAALPLEIRRMVYEYVMGCETVHLTMGMKKRFGHFVCEDQCSGEKECGCRVLVGGREGGRLDGGSVRVLCVCRRMYSESIPHLYRAHTFSLLHLTHLLYLPSRLPQQRINTIRTLRLRWAIRALPYLRRGPTQRLAYREDTANWERGWGILAGMEGLRDLYVVLVDPSPQGMWERNWVKLEERLLEPVKGVVRPRWFEVVLPFASCRLDWDMGESAVVLRKPVEGEDE
ncbi:hypothetical protein CC86DRAFT_448466 [Ophiobolus disseminans]|uniref:DUF7730 domain-containing protein n=1 Tax=Ophiobolus disseminans TaxID=1469910 RepID=A0A6A6ZN08_9PLEO|nr:hypothetical protein CC86DRAFT_448466 [Ophiobolus disseminans]